MWPWSYRILLRMISWSESPARPRLPYTWWCQKNMLRGKDTNWTSAIPAYLSWKRKVWFLLAIRWVADIWLYDTGELSRQCIVLYKKVKDRTGTMCNRGCGVNLGTGHHLLGMAKEYMILNCYTCNKCIVKERTKCVIEGCNKYPQWECGGHCEEHAMQEQRDEKIKWERGVLLRDAINIRRWVAVDIVGIMQRKSKKKENEDEVCYWGMQ